ncbi:hypothetical protein MWU52_04975 [Jannaschia sp. S6380]|uniref:hypothetical protein n=1 Tax=Jannaschia sp. S6380 TaxID=2926408 RepID=UPI001FF47C0E|nr:hypothetical protein [Jannaschia sp. S6380]MCK0166899.1 hypothetical protein [Jannaschia sp. S6380]
MEQEGTRDAVVGTMGAKIYGRVLAALAGMEALRVSVERKVSQINAMPPEEIKAAGLEAIQRDLGRAVGNVLTEEGKVKDALRIERGGAGIDLCAARAEIGRRLDRIRAASGAGDVPEGTE